MTVMGMISVAARPKSSIEIMSEVMVRSGLTPDRAVTLAFHCYQELIADGFTMERFSHPVYGEERSEGHVEMKDGLPVWVQDE